MLRFLPILLVLLLLCPSLLLAASKTSGNQAAQATYKVRQGDTLSGLAQKSRLTVAELKRLNNLSSDKLKLGQVLTVAKASAAAKAAKGTASSGKTQVATSSATHTVKSGDSLYVIAQKAKISVAELKRLNNLAGDNLKLGQVLVVSNSAGSTKTASAAAISGKAQATTASATHKVKQGDTLSEIAQKAKISVAELKRLNNLSGNNLKLGQVLVVSKKAAAPTEEIARVKMQTLTHKVKKGDTLYEIAKKNQNLRGRTQAPQQFFRRSAQARSGSGGWRQAGDRGKGGRGQDPFDPTGRHCS